MAVGNKLNDSGSQAARCNGAVTVHRVVAANGVDSDGRPRIKQAAVAKHATLANTDRPLGVAKQTKASGELVEYYSQIGALMVVECGAAVAADKDLMVDANGRVIEATSTAGQFTQLVGRSVDAGAEAGDLITMLFFPQVVLAGDVVGPDVEITGDLTLGGDLDINTDKFTVAGASGNTAVGGTLDVTGDMAVNTDKFTVAAATGNTVVGGTLNVTGATSLGSTLAVADDVTVNTDKATIDGATGNTVLAGTLEIGAGLTLPVLNEDPAAPSAGKVILYAIEVGGKVGVYARTDAEIVQLGEEAGGE